VTFPAAHQLQSQRPLALPATLATSTAKHGDAHTRMPAAMIAAPATLPVKPATIPNPSYHDSYYSYDNSNTSCNATFAAKCCCYASSNGAAQATMPSTARPATEDGNEDSSHSNASKHASNTHSSNCLLPQQQYQLHMAVPTPTPPAVAGTMATMQHHT